jgi:hypothetical protein
MNIKLPFKHERVVFDKKGNICKIEITIEMSDPNIYKPDGKKCVFRYIREKNTNREDFEIIFLIDNHEPFGFHEHSNLPEEHNVREIIHAIDWSQAWDIFDARTKELLNEA